MQPCLTPLSTTGVHSVLCQLTGHCKALNSSRPKRCFGKPLTELQTSVDLTDAVECLTVIDEHYYVIRAGDNATQTMSYPGSVIINNYWPNI